MFLSPIHTGDYSRRIQRLSPKRQLSPKTATVAEFGDYSRLCAQGFRKCSVRPRRHDHSHVASLYL